MFPTVVYFLDSEPFSSSVVMMPLLILVVIYKTWFLPCFFFKNQVTGAFGPAYALNMAIFDFAFLDFRNSIQNEEKEQIESTAILKFSLHEN